MKERSKGTKTSGFVVARPIEGIVIFKDAASC
jgi:hypothetical protein